MKYTNKRKNESGNVLFLILIAVALFAALSYAVTQSTRSGGGSTEREQAILGSASMTQHPTAMRTAIVRMILAGTDIDDLAFNDPANFTGISTNRLVFHPQGGGAVFQTAPAELMTGNNQGDWFYNGNWDVPEIGIDGVGGNEITAFLPGVSQSVCRQINEEFAIDTTGCTMDDGVVPNLDPATTEANVRDNEDDTETFPVTNQEDLQGEACTAFTRQASGCFFEEVTNGGEYVFYSVLLER